MGWNNKPQEDIWSHNHALKYLVSPAAIILIEFVHKLNKCDYIDFGIRLYVMQSITHPYTSTHASEYIELIQECHITKQHLRNYQIENNFSF